MEHLVSNLLQWVDPILIAPFRWLANPLLAFLFGCFLLSMAAVVLGELTISLAIRWNKAHLAGLNREIARTERLSLQAYSEGNSASYHALNQAANDAWGKHFFTMAAYSAGMLWPVPFALAWMHLRFADVDFTLAFPLSLLFGETVGYSFTFIPLYILSRILFKYLRPWLPYFHSVQKMLDACSDSDSSRSGTPAVAEIEKTN
jgi:hypothetical protein